jgi:hypothetical protein
MSRTELFSRNQPGGVFTISNLPDHPGESFFVDSSCSTGADAAGYGKNPDQPFLTLDYALGDYGASANKADVIYVMPGHTETLATLVTADKAGVKIIGLGEGSLRPTFTVSSTIDGISITADNVIIENLAFATPSAVATAQINIAAARATVRKCSFVQGANSRYAITVTAAGELPTIEDNEAFVTANGPDGFVSFEGVVDRPIIRHNHIIGSDGTNEYDNGCVNFGSQAVTNPWVHQNIFEGMGDATPLAAIVDAASVVGAGYADNHYPGGTTNADNVASVTATLGAGAIVAATFGAGAIDAAAIAANAIGASEIANGAIDAATFAAGAIDATAVATGAIDADAIAADTILGADNNNNAFASTSVVANADGSIIERQEYIANMLIGASGTYVPGLGYKVTKTSDMASDPDDLFDVTGKVLLALLTGEVTTVIGGAATLQIKVKTSGEALCAVTTIDTDADGTMYLLTGDAGDVLNGGDAITTLVATGNGKGPFPVVLGNAGGALTLQADLDAADTGAILWTLYYLSLEAAAAVVASA